MLLSRVCSVWHLQGVVVREWDGCDSGWVENVGWESRRDVWLGVSGVKVR